MNGTRYSTPGRHSSPFKSPGRLRSRSDGLDFAPPQDSYQVPPPPGQGGMGYTTAPVAYNVAPMGPAMYPGPAMTYQGPPIQPQGLKPMVIEGSPIKLEPSVAYAPSAAVPMGTLGFGAAVPGSYLPGQVSSFTVPPPPFPLPALSQELQSLTHSLTHLLARSLTRSFTHSNSFHIFMLHFSVFILSVSKTLIFPFFIIALLCLLFVFWGVSVLPTVSSRRKNTFAPTFTIFAHANSCKAGVLWWNPL